MNINHLGKFEPFIVLVWISIWMVLVIQFAYVASLQEAVSLSLAVVLAFYPFTTYLSKPLLKKAIQSKKVLKFTIQFLLVTLIMMILILGLNRFFFFLEEIHLFPPSALFSNQTSELRDAVGAILAVFLINFGFCGLRFFEENLKLHKIIIDSQLQTLIAQINPHFMFNVLNHVNVLIRKEPDLASTLLVQYTDILRYQLYSGKENSISLHQEIKFLKNFIEIEKVRWKNSLQVSSSWNVENGDRTVSPHLFIPFIENAFKHVSRSKSEKCYIDIDFVQKGEHVILSVINSKYAADSKETRRKDSGIGLVNIKQRLDILYAGRYSLSINETETTYSITLQISLNE